MNLAFEQPFEQPTRAHSIDPSNTVVAKWFEIRRVNTPSQSYRPGDTIDVSVDYGSDPTRDVITRFDVNTSHPDACSRNSIGFSPGADVFLVIEAGTGDTTSGGCFDPMNEGDITETGRVSAPIEPGNHEVEVKLVGRVTQRVYDRETVEILVDEAAQTPPEPPEPPDNGDDNGDDNGGGVDFPRIPGVGGEETAIVALVVLLFLFIAVSLR